MMEEEKVVEYSVVGKSLPRVDALEKVTGRAKYTIDFDLPHMLYGKMVRSPYPHARIVHLDTSRAEKLPGVRAVAAAFNTPPIKVGHQIMDRFAFPIDGKVRYVGDAVAALAAESEEIATEAADLVDVEYEELPAVYDMEEAFSTEPPAVVHPDLPHYEARMPAFHKYWKLVPERPNVCHHFRIRHGDVERGFQEADLIVENRYYIPRMNSCLIEPSVCVAWVASDGTLMVRTTTQGIWDTRNRICSAFNLPPSKVRVQCQYLGAGFGQRGYNLVDIHAALLSLRANGRPVRICFTREEHFINNRTRHPLICYLKDGVKKDGTIIARQSTIIMNMGAYCDISPHMTRNCSFAQVGTYRVPNFKLDSYGVYTNTPLSGPFRGIGNIETNWSIEVQMDIIAEKLGIDPVELRQRHFLKEGERDVTGQVVHSIGVSECLDKAVAWMEKNKGTPPEGPWRIGRGVSVSNKYTMTDLPSSATVKVHPDGVIEVRHSSGEIGMGIDTVVAQVAAEEFGVTTDHVKVISGDTALVPYGWFAIAQRETFYMGNAVRMACQDAKRQLLEIAAPKLGISAAQLEVKNRKIYVKGEAKERLNVWDLFSPPGLGYALTRGEIIGKAVFVVPGIPEDPETGQSERIVATYGYGAYAVELAVNMETGEVRILKSSGCFDAGQPINPKMCEGQVEGGIYMGIGMALYEKMVIENGVVINPNFTDYKIPTVSEMPASKNIRVMLTGVPHREGPYGAKGIGEGPVIAYPPAVSNAIYNAIGVRIKDLPISREKILQGIKETQKVLLTR